MATDGSGAVLARPPWGGGALPLPPPALASTHLQRCPPEALLHLLHARVNGLGHRVHNARVLTQQRLLQQGSGSGSGIGLGVTPAPRPRRTVEDERLPVPGLVRALQRSQVLCYGQPLRLQVVRGLRMDSAQVVHRSGRWVACQVVWVRTGLCAGCQAQGVGKRAWVVMGHALVCRTAKFPNPCSSSTRVGQVCL